MVELDFQAGTARGLSRGARDAVRRTGRLPSGLVHPAVVQAWAAVNAARAFEGKSATVADIVRARDGGWQVGQRSGWRAFGGDVERFAGGAASVDCSCWKDADADSPVGTPCGSGSGVVKSGGWTAIGGQCFYAIDCEADRRCACYELGGSKHDGLIPGAGANECSAGKGR